MLHLAFEASALKVHICDDAVLTQCELDLHAFGLCFFAESGDIDVFFCFRFGDQMLHFQSEQETFKTDRKADARCGRTADLFDEAVIAAAAADCALRSERWILDLESGIRIVVEPAHELRVDGVGDPKSCEVGFQSFELLVATLAEIVRDDRRTDSRRFAALFLAVEKSKRILVKSGLAVFTELALLGFEEFDELLSVLRTAVRIADGVQMEIEIFQSELMENLTSHRDDFRIRKRRGRTEDFQTELVEFTVTAGLRTVIAEHGADVEHLMYLLVSVHFMFQIRADR